MLGMIEGAADLLFALEAGEEGRVAFEPEQRDLQRDRPAGLQIGGLEDRAHAAAADDVGDFEALVEDLSDLKFVGHRGWQRRVIRDRPAIIPHPLHIIDAKDLHRDVVFGSALLREPHQVLAGLGRRHVAHRVRGARFRSRSRGGRRVHWMTMSRLRRIERA